MVPPSTSGADQTPGLPSCMLPWQVSGGNGFDMAGKWWVWDGYMTGKWQEQRLLDMKVVMAGNGRNGSEGGKVWEMKMVCM